MDNHGERRNRARFRAPAVSLFPAVTAPQPAEALSRGPTTGQIKRRATALLKAAQACGIDHPRIKLLPDGALEVEGGGLTIQEPGRTVPDPNPWDIALGR